MRTERVEKYVRRNRTCYYQTHFRRKRIKREMPFICGGND